MQIMWKRIRYIFMAVIVAIAFFVLSYNLIFLRAMNENILHATVLNLFMIFFIVIGEKVEMYALAKVSQKWKAEGKCPRLTKMAEQRLKDASFKSALYCFYIGILICSALIAAEPNFPVLRDKNSYFLSVRYGILVLVATDKFLEQVFKDIKKKDGERVTV